MKTKVLLLMAPLLLAGCMKLKPKDEETKPQESNPVISSHLSDIEYEFEPMDEPLKYRIVFRFKESVRQVFVVRVRGEQKNSEWQSVQDQTWIDEDLNSGETIRYQLGSSDGNQFVVWGDFDIQVPLDLVVDKDLDLSKQSEWLTQQSGMSVVNRFRRIFITETGKIWTSGRSLILEADEIHSQSGIIGSFPEGAKAEVGKDGRSGGRIELKLRRLVGSLRVEMRGENGGNGLPGKKPDAALKGPTGTKGTPGQLSNMASLDGVKRCHIAPGPGGPGGKGADGYPGKKGRRGGSTGQFIYLVEDLSQGSILLEKFPGVGGEGGPGGEGGEGGDGGPPGDVTPADAMAACYGPRGPKGPRGNPGRPGDDGEDGLIEESCEILKDGSKNCF